MAIDSCLEHVLIGEPVSTSPEHALNLPADSKSFQPPFTTDRDQGGVAMPRDFHLPGRSPTIACDGMAATSHPLATLAAIETLRAGGTAADAAVTAVALLGVIEAPMSGIGGDCFCLIAKPDEAVWGYNGSGRAPAGVRAEVLRD